MKRKGVQSTAKTANLYGQIVQTRSLKAAWQKGTRNVGQILGKSVTTFAKAYAAPAPRY